MNSFPSTWAKLLHIYKRTWREWLSTYIRNLGASSSNIHEFRVLYKQLVCRDKGFPFKIYLQFFLRNWDSYKPHQSFC